MNTDNIAILGAGNLGKAIAKGIATKSNFQPKNIILTKRNPLELQTWKEEGYMVTQHNSDAVKNSKYLFLCVQPSQARSLLNEIKNNLTAKHVLVSVMTGVSIEAIAQQIGNEVVIIRAMPNTAISVGQSMTCLAASSQASQELAVIQKMFSTVGKSMIIEEDLFQAATVLGASGIAFFMKYLRAATQGGVQMGFDAEDAQTIAEQTAKGAAQLLQTNHSHPEIEIDKVTTPQGCTIEGLNEMEHMGLSSAVIKGIMSSFHKISKMKNKKYDK